MGRLSLVKFKSGTRDQLDDTPITEGTVYFVPDSNNGNGDIAYDLEGYRSWVTSPKVLTMAELDDSVPTLGELIVVTDGWRVIDEDTQEEEVTPCLKIGDGVTNLISLPFLSAYYRVDSRVLEQQLTVLEERFEEHIEDENIHHTKNAEVTPDGDQFILQILNYDL